MTASQRTVIVLAGVFFTCAPAAPAQSPDGFADLVLRGGRVITLDAADRVAEAIAVRGDRIVAVGSDADIRRVTGPETRVIELRGRAVVPGFIDAHAHVEHTARFLHFLVNVHSPPLPSAAAVLEKVREKAATVPPRAWIVGQGTYSQPMPSRDELDRAVPDHPVALRWSMHDVLINRKAQELANITRTTPDPRGGKIERDADGDPTGILREAFDLLPIPPYPTAGLRTALEATLREVFLQQGVTTVYELPATTQAIRIYQALHAERALPVRLHLNYTVAPGHQPLLDLDSLVQTGIHTGFGDAWLKIGAIKIFVDGAGPSAATYRPEQPGLLMRAATLLNSQVRKAHAAGWQLWIHAIGDRAQDMALDALEGALRETPRADHRHRIEHLGNTVVKRDVLDRAKHLGVIPVPTGAFLWRTRDEEARRPDGPRLYAFRTLLDHGFRPAGNADTAGTQTFAINPMFSLSRLVLRTNRSGAPVQPEEAVSVEDALRIHTLFAARAGFEDHIKGSLEPGKLADLVVLSEDPLAVPPARLMDMRVECTIIGGTIAYERR